MLFIYLFIYVFLIYRRVVFLLTEHRADYSDTYKESTWSLGCTLEYCAVINHRSPIKFGFIGWCNHDILHHGCVLGHDLVFNTCAQAQLRTQCSKCGHHVRAPRNAA